MPWTLLYFSGSHPEVILLPRGHLVISRDIFDDHKWEVWEEGLLVTSER